MQRPAPLLERNPNTYQRRSCDPTSYIVHTYTYPAVNDAFPDWRQLPSTSSAGPLLVRVVLDLRGGPAGDPPVDDDDDATASDPTAGGRRAIGGAEHAGRRRQQLANFYDALLAVQFMQS